MARTLGILWTALGFGCLAAGGWMVSLGRFPYVALFWPGMVLLLVGGSHVVDPTNPTAFTGKDTATGRISPSRVLLMAPYFLLVWGWWLLRVGVLRAAFKEPACNEVWGGVYVARYPSFASSIPPDTRLVVDLTAEFPGRRHRNAEYLCCPAPDTGTPSPVAWYRAALRINAARRAGQTVFVHCAYGHGRSAITVALAMLLSDAHDDLDACEAALQSRRPCIRFHRNQMAVVRAIAEDAATFETVVRRDAASEGVPSATPDTALLE